MSINDNKITFWTSPLSQSQLIESNATNGAFVYSTTDKVLYLIDGARSEIGRAIHPISTIIPVNSLPNTTDTTINEALYLFNNYLYFYDGSSMKKLLKDGDLTSYITDEILAAKAYLTEAELNTVLAKKDYVTTTMLNEKGYVTETNLAGKNYVEQSEITDFITADSLEGYAKSTELSNYLTTSNANSTYLKISDATSTYAKSTDLSNYLTKNEAKSTYLTTVNADDRYATIAGLNNTEAIAQTNKANITTVTGRVDTLESKTNTIQGTVGTHESNITELIEFTGYTAQDENDPTDRPSLTTKITNAETEINDLNTNKLNKISDTSTNLTESSKFTVGTANSDRIEITNSTINKYSENSTNGTSVLFKGDVSVSNSDNTYTINDGNGHTITITIPADLVVKNGTVEEKTSDFTYDGVTYKAGTYIVLKLNNSEETLIYINVTDLVDEYIADNLSEAPVQITIKDRAISGTLKDNSVTSQYLADDITLTSLIVPTIKGSNATPPATITINGAEIDSNGGYSGNAKTATNLTNGKSISIDGDMAGTISNIGTSSSSGTLTLNIVNTTANDGTGNKITVSPTVTSSTKDDIKINIPATTVNGKGLVTKVENVSTSIGATNLVKQIQNQDDASYPLLFTNNSTDGADASIAFNSNITINPKAKTITADNFIGNAQTATAFSTDQTVAISGGATGTSAASAAGWTVPITLNSKLIAGVNNTAVVNASSVTTNDTTYLNLYAPNASNTDTVLSSLQLKGSGATAVSAANGVITITSTDYSNAIATAQSTAINTASADATTKADAAKTDAISNAATLYLTKSDPIGTGSFSLNRKTGTTIGEYSFAEGSGTTASGNNSHAEGSSTIAVGDYSHAEGNITIAFGEASHAEGTGGILTVTITGNANTKTYTLSSSNINIKVGQAIYFNGITSKITEYDSTIPSITVAATLSSTALSAVEATIYRQTASGSSSHAEGACTIASGQCSHAEGNHTKASGNSSHAEGNSTIASGYYSHAEGYGTTASGYYSHAEGNKTTASSYYSHAEGNSTIASGESSHAEGYDITASGYYSHAEGNKTTASGKSSHAEGYDTTASGYYSHAEGNKTTASGQNSHAGGYYTTATTRSMTAIGEYNKFETITPTIQTTTGLVMTKSYYSRLYYYWGVTISDTEIKYSSTSRDYSEYIYKNDYFHTSSSISNVIYQCTDISYDDSTEEITITYTKYEVINPHNDRGIDLFVIGNGTDNDARSNAHTLDWKGNAWFAGDVYVGSKSGTNKDEGSKKLATVDDITAAIGNAIAASY